MDVVLIFVFAILIGALAGAAIVYFVFLRKPKTVITHESDKINLAEAEKALKKSGFTILESPAKRTMLTLVDGRNYFGEALAEFVVGKGKKTFVVKIQDSPVLDFSEPSFRRLLLECEYAFRSDGILTFDPVTKEIHQVNFSSPKKSLQEIIFQYLIIGFIIMVIAAIIGLLVVLKLY